MFADGSNRFLIALLLIFLALFAAILYGFLTPLLFALIIAGAIYPLYERLAARLHQHTNIAALLIVLLITLLIVLPFSALATLLAREAVHLFSSGGVSLDTWQEPLHTLSTRLGVDVEQFFTATILPAINNLGALVTQELGGIISNTFQLALDFLIMLVTVFYLLRDGKRLGAFLMRLSPLPSADETGLYKTFRETGTVVIVGNFASALAQGIAGGVGFALFGLSLPVFWGAVIAFFGLIPLLGAYVVFVPTTIYLLFTGNIATAALFLLYNLLLVSSVDNIIKAKLISGKTSVHPLLILIAILGGLKAFGFIGIIYGPVIIAVFLAIVRLYEHSKTIQHAAHTQTVQ